MGATRTNRLPPRKGARHLVALLHGWIGVFASLFIFLIAATGLALAFFGDVRRQNSGAVVCGRRGSEYGICSHCQQLVSQFVERFKTFGFADKI